MWKGTQISMKKKICEYPISNVKARICDRMSIVSLLMSLLDVLVVTFKENLYLGKAIGFFLSTVFHNCRKYQSKGESGNVFFFMRASCVVKKH